MGITWSGAISRTVPAVQSVHAPRRDPSPDPRLSRAAAAIVPEGSALHPFDRSGAPAQTSGVRTRNLVVAASLAAVSLVAAGLSSTGWSASGAGAATDASAPKGHAVGLLTETFVDTSRSTPAAGPNPHRSSRTLRTTIFYPAAGGASAHPAQTGATPDRAGGPYPLIVFAHGLGADPQAYGPLLSYWAASGFVVAAPQFPLTSGQTPGGTDAGDVVNQPGDMSFVVSSVLAMSGRPGHTLSGLIDPGEIGAAGHSNGAITTLGLVANTCCLDYRIKAAAILAGDNEGFPGGRYDFGQAPPILFVHGTDDAFLPYSEAIAMFNRAHGPKGLLTIKGGGHADAAGGSAASANSVYRTTTDFFSAYLRGDRAARARLPTDGRRGVTTLQFDPQPGPSDTIPTLPVPALRLRASVDPAHDLVNGQTVSVRWSGYTPGRVVNVLECVAGDLKSKSVSACSLTHARILVLDPTGRGSLQLKIVEGAVGTGTCDGAHPGCLVVVNDASSTDPAASVEIPISFRS